MNNHRLRALIVRLQDRLSEDDRKRLHFVLGDDVPRRIRDDPSLGGTLSLIESLSDQDKINAADFTFLINAFDEIQCMYAAKLLREYMKEMQSEGISDSGQNLSVVVRSLADTTSKDQEDRFAVRSPLINKENYSNNNNIINNINKNIKVGTHVNGNERKAPSPSTPKQFSMTIPPTRTICSNLFMGISIVLIGVVVGCVIWIVQLKNGGEHVAPHQGTNKTIINAVKKELLLNISDLLHRVKDSLSKNTTINFGELFKRLRANVVNLENDLKNEEGTTCSCDAWCRVRGSPHGICGDGPTCICTQWMLSKEEGALRGCTCDQWCQEHNHKNGGICGDGYTCICSS